MNRFPGFVLQRFAALAVILMLAGMPAAHAVIGAAPDSPTALVDPNILSSPWSGVGSLVVDGSPYSAVLIAPGYVLTAAHVVYGKSPASMTFNLNVGSSFAGTIGVDSLYVNPGFAGFIPAADGFVHSDLAVVKLSSSAPAGVSVYNLTQAPIKAGELLTFVGYGASGDGVNGVTVAGDSHVKRVGENHVEILPANSPDVYGFSFDQFSTLGPREATLGPGDSGSPTFVKDLNGKWSLAGINTFVGSISGGPTTPGTFGTIGGGMMLSAYAPWISSVVVSAVPEPSAGLLMLVGLGMAIILSAVRTLVV